MKPALLFLITTTLLAACSAPAVPATQAAAPPQPSPTRTAAPSATAEPTVTTPRIWRIMPLGDSLTDGDFLNGSHSYRGYLETQLREAGYRFDFVGSQWKLAHSGTDYEHEGHGGFTIGPDDSMASGWSANLYARMDVYLKTEPDIILLLIGINDLFPNAQRPVDPAQADEKLAGLVEYIQKLKPGTYIFVSSLVPVGWEWTDYQAEYDDINRMAEQLGNADLNDRVYFVDMNRKLAPMIKSADFVDDLHLTESGARKVAQVWFEALQESGILEPLP